MASDDEYVAIQRLQHPITGVMVYVPEGQELPDTKATLERDGLITCQYDEHGKYVGTIVYDPQNIRVLCWQLTVNADARRLGREPVFTDLPADLTEHGVLVRSFSIMRDAKKRQMSDDACVAIQKWQHPTNGTVIYFPVGQELPDTEQTLVQAGLLGRRGDGVVVLDARSTRVICWQLTQNAAARRCGHGDIWEDLPTFLHEDLPGSEVQ